MKNLLGGKVCLALIIFAVAAAWPADSFAALNTYLKVTGAAQGDIEGSVTQAGREGSIEVNEVHHLVSNVDGRVKHEPLVFTKPVDISSPKLYQALDTGESLTMVFRFWRPGPAGVEEQYYTITLGGAKLTAIEPIMRDNKIPENMQLQTRERIRATYRTVIFAWEGGGVETILTNPVTP